MEEANIAVPLVGAAFSHEGHLSAGRLAEFGLIVRGQNLSFLDGVWVEGYVGPAVVAGIHVRCAVDSELVLIGARAVDIKTSDAAGARLVKVARPNHAGNQLHVIEHVATV